MPRTNVATDEVKARAKKIAEEMGETEMDFSTFYLCGNGNTEVSDADLRKLVGFMIELKRSK